MKVIKWLWSILFAFLIVLFYATLTSLFVTPNSEWYISLAKSATIPTPTFITIGWAINYLLSIIVLTRLIYKHDNRAAIVIMIVLGLLQILWSIVFFAGHSLLGGLVVQIILVGVSLVAARYVAKDSLWLTILFAGIVLWYVITTVAGYNLWLLNTSA